MDIQKITESLSPIERKILPFLEEPKIIDICKKSNMDKVSVIRALEYLQNKKVVNLTTQKKKIIEIGVNGALYKKKGLPERRLLNLLNEKRIIPMKDAQKESKLSSDEFKVSIGVLKRKALIELKNGKVIFSGGKEEIAKKFLEEQFIENLPVDYETLSPEQLFALKNLQSRKNIIQIEEQKKISIEITELGKELMSSEIKVPEMIEQITPELIKKETNWKGKKFRRYDVSSPVPEIYGGKRHFVNQALDYARKIWTDMGFQEMTGNLVQSSFWNFDALFTAQDHPVRELQDTFYLGEKQDLMESIEGKENKKLIQTVRDTHENGISGSKGWKYKWDEEDSKKLVLRTHTTCLSATKLYELSYLPESERRGKFFSLGKNFRNETVDWAHGFEFYQTEGIVVDDNVHFRHLLGYLKQFYKKMGFEKIRFTPAYFPYTEPSVEINVFHPGKKVWLELGGAGIFRPEITVPLLGKKTPVLAWGQGFDRIIMDFYKIKDLRELYKNNLTQLRKTKFWVKQ